MLATGIKSPIGIKVNGSDLAVIDGVAIAIKKSVCPCLPDTNIQPFTKNGVANAKHNGYGIN